MLVPFDPVYVWINNYSGDYCSWPHLVLNKASTSGRNASVWLGEWGRGFWHEGRLKSEIRDWVRPPAFLRAITLQWHDVNKSTNTVLVVKALVTQEIARYCHFITWPPLYLRLPWQQRRAVMLMTVGSSCVPRALSRWNKTHTLSTQRADKTHNREHQITQRDMASHSPQDSDDTSVRPNQSTHTHKHTVHSHWGHWKYPVTHTSTAVHGDDIRKSTGRDEFTLLLHTATLKSRDTTGFRSQSNHVVLSC